MSDQRSEMVNTVQKKPRAKAKAGAFGSKYNNTTQIKERTKKARRSEGKKENFRSWNVKKLIKRMAE